MSSIKIILWKHRKKKDGSFPLRLRITHNRKTRYIFIGHHIQEKDWDEVKSTVKKSHPNSTRLNNLIIQKLAEANQTLIDLETEKKAISSKSIKDEIVVPLTQTTFNQVAQSYLDELERTSKLKRLSSDKTRVNHFNTFANNDDLTFQHIDESFLKRFSLHLKTKKKVSERSIINNLIVIRTLFNRAIKLGIVDAKYYPFGKGKIQLKFPETEKVGLNIEEIKALELTKDLPPKQDHARNIWLTSFYFGGIRIGDVLKLQWSDIYDGRLHYRMGKNKKLLSLKVSDKAHKIFEKYKANKKSESNFIFPDLKTANPKDPKDIYRKEKIADKHLNRHIREVMTGLEINKRIGFHSARHSFAHLSSDIDVRQLQKIFRHSNLTTTIGYMESINHTNTDDALDKVTGF